MGADMSSGHAAKARLRLVRARCSSKDSRLCDNAGGTSTDRWFRQYSKDPVVSPNRRADRQMN